MDALKDKERLAYEMFLLIEQSANGSGEAINEDGIWQSFMEICNARCGTRFASPDAARIAVGRISSTIPLERLEELYEEATGREINLDRPIQYSREVKDRSPEDVRQTLARLPSEADGGEAGDVDNEVDPVEFFDELEQDWLEDFQRQWKSERQKGQRKRFSQT